MAEALLWNADGNVLGIFASTSSGEAGVGAGLDQVSAVAGEAVSYPGAVVTDNPMVRSAARIGAFMPAVFQGGLGG